MYLSWLQYDSPVLFAGSDGISDISMLGRQPRLRFSGVLRRRRSPTMMRVKSHICFCWTQWSWTSFCRLGTTECRSMHVMFCEILPCTHPARRSFCS
jgi:hypothetical protein